MKSLFISYKQPFSLTLAGPRGPERLAIRSEYPDTPLAGSLFRHLGLMHLVAHYLPWHIRTDFPVDPRLGELIRRMYNWERRPAPIFQKFGPRNEIPALPETGRGKIAVLVSGGKDSLWNMRQAEEAVSKDNVLAIHIAGINQLSGSEEKKAALRQRDELGFKNFVLVDLLNSSENRGYSIMRSRQMFLIGLAIPLAIEFGASRIIIEGFGECAQGERFTGDEKNMLSFNKLLRSLGIPTKAAWTNRDEMDILKDLILEKPEWLALANSCFSAKYFKGNTRKSWQRKTPTFPLFETQCGSCLKCRVTNIARIRYDKYLREAAQPKDIAFYIASTHKWLKDNREEVDDILTDSFAETLTSVAKKYGTALQ